MIIGLTGYAQTGKDTFAKSLKLRSKFFRVAFADALKEMALVLNPVLEVDYEYERLQWIVRNLGWEEAKKISSVREYLQLLGADACRDILGQGVWVQAAEPKVIGALKDGNNVVITDVRFPNEVAFVKAYGGVVIKIVRDGVMSVNDHISDTGIDDLACDRVVFNNGSLSDLALEAQKVINALGL